MVITDPEKEAPDKQTSAQESPKLHVLGKATSELGPDTIPQLETIAFRHLLFAAGMFVSR